MTAGIRCARCIAMSKDKTQVSFLLDSEDMSLLRELAWMARLPVATYLRNVVREKGKELEAEDKRVSELVP